MLGLFGFSDIAGSTAGTSMEQHPAKFHRSVHRLKLEQVQREGAVMANWMKVDEVPRTCAETKRNSGKESEVQTPENWKDQNFQIRIAFPECVAIAVPMEEAAKTVIFKGFRDVSKLRFVWQAWDTVAFQRVP
eukprot:s1344_g1.t1